MTRMRKVPQRTCLGCQAMRPKKELMRIVRTPTGDVLIDPTGKKAGRGAYICTTRNCLDKAMLGSRLDRALEINLTSEMRATLHQELAGIMP